MASGARAIAAVFLDDEPWAVIESLLPTHQRGARRVDDRQVSSIAHVSRSGCRWQDTPLIYGPLTTVYDRVHRWSQRGI